MATMNLSPDAILESTGFASGQLSYIQDSPSSPDANWYVTTAGVNSVLRVSFPTPTQPSTLTTTASSQTFNVRVRVTQSGATTAMAQIQLYKNGTLVSSGTNTAITNTTGITLTYTWTPTANDDGSAIECRVVTTSDTSGSATAKGQVDIGAIQWVADYTPTVVLPVDSVKMPLPTDLFPFPASAWKRPEVIVKVSTSDNTPAKLVVEHGTSSTLASYTTTTSASVASGIKVTLSLGTYAEDAEIYWRCYISNDVVTSNKTAINHFTNDGSYAYWDADGTPFMQQGGQAGQFEIIDVSEYQSQTTPIDWQAVYNGGVRYAYLRAYGVDHTGNGDIKFEQYVTDARAVGIKTGAYFYANVIYPFNDVTSSHAEADKFIAKLQAGYGTGQYGDLIPMFDLEDNSGQAIITAGQSNLSCTVDYLLQWGNEFRNYFEAQTGRTLGLYTGDNFVRDQRGNFNWNDTTWSAVAGTSGNLLQDMPLWIQGYTNYSRYKGNVMPSCGGWMKWHMFQYTQVGSTSGVTGNNDRSWCESANWIVPPTNVTGVSATDDGTNITMTWTANTEIDIDGYNIYLDGALHDYVAGKTNTTYVYTGLTIGVAHSIGVTAVDTFQDDSPNITSINHTILGSGGGGNPDPTNAPVVNIVSVSRNKISDEPDTEVNKADIRFTFNVDVKSYTVNVNGVDYATGTVADSGGGQSVLQLATQTVSQLATKTVQSISTIPANTEIVVTVDYTELAQEGENRVNIYGQAIDGTWTPYYTPPDVTPPEDVTSLNYISLTSSSLTLTWVHSSSTDRQDYTVYKNGIEIGTTLNDFYDITGLTADTLYVFEVVTNDTSANVSTGVTVNVTTPIGSPVVAEVSNLAVSYKTYSEVDLIWDSSPDASYYEVYYKESSYSEWSSWEQTGVTESYITTLNQTTDYDFKVVVVDVNGNRSNGVIVTATTDAFR